MARIDVQRREACDIECLASFDRQPEIDVQRLKIAPERAGGREGELADHLQRRHVHAEGIAIGGGGEDLAGPVPRRSPVRMLFTRVHEPALEQLERAGRRISETRRDHGAQR